jgi:hypothetical protein
VRLQATADRAASKHIDGATAARRDARAGPVRQRSAGGAARLEIGEIRGWGFVRVDPASLSGL